MKTHTRRLLGVLGSVLTGGFVVASGCTVSEVQTVLTGIDAVAEAIASLDDDGQDISFGDWLADELSD